MVERKSFCKVRHSVSDETAMMLGLITGTLNVGDSGFWRQGGNLVLVVFDPVRDSSGFSFFRKQSDFGSATLPGNLARYYRNLGDASVDERRIMLDAGVINRGEYDASFGSGGCWWGRQDYLNRSLGGLNGK